MSILQGNELHIKILSSLREAERDNEESLESRIGKMQEFLEMQQLYRSAIREITTKLEILDDEFRVRFAHDPIHHIESRLKSLPSMLEKLQRKQADFEIATIRHELTDIAGVRVICNYLEDIYRIAELLTAQDDIELLRTKDYIKEPKPNGYRGLHLIVRVPVFLSSAKEMVPVEIQIRTIAMDFWASLEHQLRYKTVHEVPDDLHTRLKQCSDVSAALDTEMQRIFNVLNAAELQCKS